MIHNKNNTLEPEPQSVPFILFENTYQIKHNHFYLSSPLEEPHKYAHMIHTILSTSEQDVNFFHLNCPGGYLSTGTQIISAIRHSPAKCVGMLEAEASSMASLIFLACDEYVVNDYSTIMIHNFSGGAGNGKGHEIAAAIQSTTETYQKMARDLYKGFLTPTEMKKVFEGMDLYLHSEEIIKRLQNNQKKH